MKGAPASRAGTLAGQVAVVTGASSGIGRAIAIELARSGAEVVVNDASGGAAADEVVARCRELGVRATSAAADVSDERAVDSLFATARDAFGRVDVLVSNAGIQRDAAVHEMSLADWNRVIAVNLTGAFLCARAATREFLARDVRPEVSVSRGKIVFVGSVHEVIPWAGHANYAASKGGLAMLMKTLAQELAPTSIRVNGVAPGAIRTPINRAAWETPAAYADLVRLIPRRRIGEPEEIGRAVAWLASDAADYVTGHSLVIDGGMTLYPGFESGG